MKNKSKYLLKLSHFDPSGKTIAEYKLTQEKILIGKKQSSDIYLEDEMVSEYHAMIFIQEDGAKIVDLESINGIYINSKKVDNNSFFTASDILQIGNTILHCLEYEDSEVLEIKKEHVKKLKKTVSEDQLPITPKEGMIIVDGEYCDASISEKDFIPLAIPPKDFKFDFKDYIDPSDVQEPNNEMVQPIIRDVIELCVTTSGTIISIDYLELRNTTYFANGFSSNSRTILIPGINSNKSIPFITVDQGTITLHKLDNHICSHDLTNNHRLNPNEQVVYTSGTNQIFIKITNAPPILSRSSFQKIKDQFSIDAVKSVSILMSFMILLLLVDDILPIPEAKQIAIIYKKPIISEDGKVDDGGTKKEIQDPSKNQKSKKPQKVKPKEAPKVETTKAPSPETNTVKTPVKTYEFKMKKSLNSFMDSKVDVNNLKVKDTKSKTSATSFNSNNASDTDLREGVSAEVGTLGSDDDGDYDQSFGARGLYSKDGVDTTYVQPKTIVLGSIDPELLRKILQEYLPQFRHCYQQELEINDAIKGVVDLNFQIDANGNAGKINIKTTQSAFTQRGLNCMGKVLKLIQFPKPKGGGVVDVRQPLNFFSEKG